MNAMTGTWTLVGALAEFPPQGARVVKTPGGCIAVFRTAEDEVFALNDRCPHKGGPLSEGIVHGQQVTCPLHAWVFDLNSGTAQGADVGQVQTWPARVQDGQVFLDISALG